MICSSSIDSAISTSTVFRRGYEVTCFPTIEQFGVITFIGFVSSRSSVIASPMGNNVTQPRRLFFTVW